MLKADLKGGFMDSIILYGGIAAAVLAVLSAAVYFLVLKARLKALKAKLTEEYGIKGRKKK